MAKLNTIVEAPRYTLELSADEMVMVVELLGAVEWVPESRVAGYSPGVQRAIKLHRELWDYLNAEISSFVRAQREYGFEGITKFVDKRR